MGTLGKSVLCVLPVFGWCVALDARTSAAAAADSSKVEKQPSKPQPKKKRGSSERSRANAAAKKFSDLIEELDAASELVTSVDVDREMPTLLVVHVTDDWADMSKARRSSSAEDFWKLWVSSVAQSGPGRIDPDHWRISIVNRHGHRIGGSRVWGGSLIWVDD
jgi:hypothetical protein